MFPARTTRINGKKDQYVYRVYLYVFRMFLPKEKWSFPYMSLADCFYKGDGMCLTCRAIATRKKRIQGKAQRLDCLQLSNIRVQSEKHYKSLNKYHVVCTLND